MLETLDLEATLDDQTYETRKQELEERLARAQREAVEYGVPVLVIIDGWNYTGKARTVQFLTAPMDPRGFKVATWVTPTRGERAFPPGLRYMARTPRRGEVMCWIRSYYSQELERRVAGRPPRWHRLKWSRIREMEQALAADGVVIVKLWLHLGKDELARRRREEPHDPQWSPVVDPKQDRRYRTYEREFDRMLQATNHGAAPWHPIAATDLKHARIAVADEVARRMEEALAARQKAHDEKPSPPPAQPVSVQGNSSRFAAVDLTLDIDPDEYKPRLDALQDELADVQYRCMQAGRPVVIAFEGWDAAGKGGAIRRLRQKLNPCHYDVHSVAAPDEDEKRHHYLWRFWHRMPPAGVWGVFDRSWYGRVLVERVESLIPRSTWERAYDEINQFEGQLAGAGAVVVKMWLHISPDEQLRRFREREETPHKRYKIGEEDWRNREKWDAYLAAAEDMFQRTDTPTAPWTVISATSKRHARVQVLETVLRSVNDAL